MEKDARKSKRYETSYSIMSAAWKCKSSSSTEYGRSFPNSQDSFTTNHHAQKLHFFQQDCARKMGELFANFMLQLVFTSSCGWYNEKVEDENETMRGRRVGEVFNFKSSDSLSAFLSDANSRAFSNDDKMVETSSLNLRDARERAII